MSVLIVGLSHRSAPVEVLERLAVAPDDVPKLLEEMLDRTHVEEAVLLSTCNRIEICAVVDAFHGGLGDVTDVLGSYAGFPIGELSDHLFVHYAGSAVQHLFALAAGLDSMVVGESQILGQLRSAYATADGAGSVGKVLHELVQQALRVGKRVHAGTGIDEAGASVVSEALRDADRELGGGAGDGLHGSRVVIVGAGAMGALAAAHLRRAGASEIVVLNRSVERGERLVEKVLEQGTHARFAALDDLAAELAGADLMLACTGAIGHVVGTAPVTEALAGGRERPLVVCDLGLPRDVDPARRTGAHPGAPAQLSQDPPVRDERVARVLPARDGGDPQVGRLGGGKVLERVHGDVDVARGQRVAQRRHEHPDPELGHRRGRAVTAGRDGDDLARVPGCGQPVGDRGGLGDRQLRRSCPDLQRAHEICSGGRDPIAGGAASGLV